MKTASAQSRTKIVAKTASSVSGAFRAGTGWSSATSTVSPVSCIPRHYRPPGAYHGIAMMLRPAALFLALAASSLAWGEAPPERMAYLSYVEGTMTFDSARQRASSALPDRPLRPGDRVATHPGGRAEMSLGAAVVRLDERTELAIADLDDVSVRLELDAGIASVHARELFDDETFEVVTPNATIAIDAPGEYRVEAVSRDLTFLTVHGGAANVESSSGPVRVADGQRVRLESGDANASLVALGPADAFDEWVMQRELQLAAAGPPTDVPDTYAGYGELDRYGDWYYDSYYGRVWSPYYTGTWKPRHDGHWQHDGHGWIWVDSAPWGFSFAIQSGHWTFLYG